MTRSIKHILAVEISAGVILGVGDRRWIEQPDQGSKAVGGAIVGVAESRIRVSDLVASQCGPE